MGDYEVYCALCGFILHDLYLEDASYDYRRSQLPAGEEEPPWLNEMQIMGENLDAPTLQKVYVSGPRTACAVGNSFDVDPGADPRFPARGMVRYGEDGRADLCVYDWTVHHGYAIPYHRACYHVLEKAITYYSGTRLIDLELLYETLRNRAASHPEIHAAKVLPGIDYGSAARAHRGGWWWPRQGYETFTWDPTDIPDLWAYYAEMPLLRGEDSGDERGRDRMVQRPTTDPFARLPANVLHSILHALPTSSVARLRMASPAIAQTELSNDFWASKIKHDMPWLYDLPNSDSPNLDWERIYQHLWLRSQDSFPFQMRGLVNRRRIWTICAQIAQPYAVAKRKSVKEHRRQHPPPILDKLVASPMRPLRLPRVLAPRTGHLLLADEMQGFARPRPTLTVFWTRRGTLAGFQTSYINWQGRETTETVGATAHPLARNAVHIAEDDWIRGFILTSCSTTNGEQHRSVVGLEVLFLHADPLHLGITTGDKRLLHAEGDNLLIGLTAQWVNSDDSDSEISALSLLHAHPEGNHRANTLSNLQTRHPDAHTTITTKLWKAALPPPTHLVTERQPGFWPDGFDPSLEPMECLTLGLTDSDLASITALSVDVFLGGVRVHYSNQPPQTIGPRLAALKTLPIDGHGGERIAAVIVHGADNNGLTVVTNRNRQLIVGSRVGGTHYFVPGQDQYITGLYGAWKNGHGHLQWLSTTFSSLPTTQTTTATATATATATYSPPPTQPPQETDGQYPWDTTSPPPKPYTPKGPIYGTHTWTSRYGFDEECPSPRTAYTTWLDCSQASREPLQKVRVVFAHPTRRLPFSPVGIGLGWKGGRVDWVGVSLAEISSTSSSSFTTTAGGDAATAGGDAATAGATPTGTGTTTSKPTINNNNTIPRCPCTIDTLTPLSKEEMTHTPHFTEEEWSVPSSNGDDNGSSGGTLHSLRLWTRTSKAEAAEAGPGSGPEQGTGPLLGFQFVCSTGVSPLWGRCEGLPAGVIHFKEHTPSYPTSTPTPSTTTSTSTPRDNTHTHEDEDEKRTPKDGDETNTTSEANTDDEGNKAIGLKIFIDENDRPGVDSADSSIVFSDPVMVCFQALTIS